ncbi:DUF4476 domain-containing protein [Mucilaginibacter conchicola]|uniref:DUF4476 domain-containing protein n=1 Tax=Mucilaginibacter conchicola TaxID=2303333 RepID=A0A372NVG2_9SPHI|nr:DUF4476 domain-containing protein [Mucilaginibacter conchicola]RFZ93004.1 DUF4476 domain-containing protein [Mucilaginibacter conchicola]
MKKLLTLIILSTTIAQADAIIKSAPAAIIQKIKHPEKAMEPAEAKAILREMQQQSTDEDKIKVLKAGVKDKGINMDQLLTLLNQFNTDDSKIEAAKFAFPYTTNYKSFLRICDIFSREEYKDALEDFYKKNK